ncbi:hypothetical protein QT714_22515, partial [Xanthomonas citri pv. citri]
GHDVADGDTIPARIEGQFFQKLGEMPAIRQVWPPEAMLVSLFLCIAKTEIDIQVRFVRLCPQKTKDRAGDCP